ncbi:MAG: S49 family peptidase, partial [Candidatus Krumholzibacteriia bacterium]
MLGALDGIVRLVRGPKPYGILKISVGGELAEGEVQPRWISVLRREPGGYLDLLNLLRWARDDAQLRGVLVCLDGVRVGWARSQGLRRALLDLRAAGKRVWVHVTQGGLHEYLIASAGERVSLSPSGTLDVAGLSAEATFFLGTLEKLGIQADLVQVGEYKAAGEPFLRRDMSPQHREMVESLVDDLYQQVVAAVSEAR